MSDAAERVRQGIADAESDQAPGLSWYGYVPYDAVVELLAERDRLRDALRNLQDLIEGMDRKMTGPGGGVTEDEDGFINSYRIPVGPWHRILAASRQITTGRAS